MEKVIKKLSDFEFIIKFVFILCYGIFVFLLGLENSIMEGIFGILGLITVIEFAISLEDNARLLRSKL